MSTGVVVADWIKRLVDEERKRDAVRVREEAEVGRKADFVRVHGRRLIDELRATVTRDVEAFRDEFPRARARHRLGSHRTRRRVCGSQASVNGPMTPSN